MAEDDRKRRFDINAAILRHLSYGRESKRSGGVANTSSKN